MTHYPQLKPFFVHRLGVSEAPTPRDYADLLTELSQEEQIGSDDERTILRVYKELDYHLNPEGGRTPICEEDWWDTFANSAILWTDKEEFWNNDDDVFVNDSPRLYGMFKDNANIAFLKLPQNYYPKIQRFVQATGVQRLSKAVSVLPATDETPQEEPTVREWLQRLVPYVVRYLYSQEHDSYERLKRDGVLAQLNNLTVCSLTCLDVEYTLSGQSARAQGEALLIDGRLLIQRDHLEDNDIIAQELSKLLGEMTGLDSFLISLLDRRESGRIESLMRVKCIETLPEEEQQCLEMTQTAMPSRESFTDTPEQPEITQPSPQQDPVLLPTEATAATDSEHGSQRHEGTPMDVGVSLPMDAWKEECRPEDAAIQIAVSYTPLEGSPRVEPRAPSGTSAAPGEDMTETPEKETNGLDSLSPKDRSAIGRWGEHYAFRCLRSQMIERYSSATPLDSRGTCSISRDGERIAEVCWVNSLRDEGEGYDIRCFERGGYEYFEVKSTETTDKEWFQLSRRQWEFAQQQGDRFHIYRVYGAGTTDPPNPVDIKNPFRLWEQGHLTAYPTRLHI